MGFHLDFGGFSLFLFGKPVCPDRFCDTGRHCPSQSPLSDLDKMEEEGGQICLLAQSVLTWALGPFSGK